MLTGISSPVFALRINEIMYDPQYNENYNEWIELYNEDDEPIDLTNITICGKALGSGYIDRSGEVHNEEDFFLAPEAYAIITDGGSGSEVYTNYDIPASARAFHVNAASICGGLGNEGDIISITTDNETIDEVTYAGEAEPGFSLEFREGSFFSSADIDGTPGRENSEGRSQNDSNNDSPQNDPSDDDSQDGEDEKPKSKESPPESVPGFVPLYPNAPIQPSDKEKKKITLSSMKNAPLYENTSEVYLTSEGKIRQTVIYAFAGFCIALTLLIVLKKV